MWKCSSDVAFVFAFVSNAKYTVIIPTREESENEVYSVTRSRVKKFLDQMCIKTSIFTWLLKPVIVTPNTIRVRGEVLNGLLIVYVYDSKAVSTSRYLNYEETTRYVIWILSFNRAKLCLRNFLKTTINTYFQWFLRFRHDRRLLGDHPNIGRFSTIAMDQNVPNGA